MGIQVESRKFAPRSSSSEVYDPESGACSVDFYMALKDPFRVTPGNKIPVAWPYDMSRPSNEAEEIVDTLRNEYENILRGFGIKLHGAGVQGLSPRGYHQPKDTLIINTHDENNARWKEAADAIQKILDKAIRKRTSGLKIRVEIRNDTKLYRDTSTFVKPGSLVHKAFLEIENAVYEEVEKNCSGQWRVISYVMRGPAFQTENRKPTVMVRIATGTVSLWAFIEKKIIAAITSACTLDIRIDVEILPGCALPLISLEMLPVSPFIYRDLPENPVNGSSVGARGVNEAGSLGVWVDFQPAGNAEKQRCFLTCHHVISSGDSANKSFNDHHGIGLEGRQIKTPITVDYPAPFDAAATKQHLQWEISQGKDNDGRRAKVINDINNYASAGGIGFVIHASGYFRQSKDGRRMDWALVRAHRSSPSQRNRPPPANFSPPELWNGRLEYNVNADEVISKSASLTGGEWVAKVGRTTGVTTGEVNAMKAWTYWENGQLSKEISILGSGTGADFAGAGDSGAMVINPEKEWVGMLIGKISLDNHALITSTQELMDDIKAKTGGSISLV